MKLIITIDTEEDNWGHYSPTGHTLENIDRIPLLQKLFDDFNVKPTYLISYPVAVNDKCISILREIDKADKCEIGMHCHPWNTPPFDEETNERNSMLCNLPKELQYKKLSILHKTIQKNFGIAPVSFRAGRWGYNRGLAENLYRLGYKVDTSITAYTDWTRYYGPDFSNIAPMPFRYSCESIFQESSNGYLLEVPATIGYLQQNFTLSNYISKLLSKKPINKLRLIGLLNKLHLLNKVLLSPEASDSKSMVRLAKCLIKKDFKFINMFFHSTSLKAGLTDFVKTKDDEKRFFQQIREFLIFTKDAGIESIKLSDVLNQV